jgi:Protein of unknown function (DUF5132)
MEELIVGLVVGVCLVAVGKRVYRPALKSAIKAGIAASEIARDGLHEGREQLFDLVAEARHEVEVSRRAREGSASGSSAPN